MQLIKHALTLTKIFSSKLFSIVIVFSAAYTYRSYIGVLDNLEKINSFSIIFIAAYFLGISAVWTIVYFVTCVKWKFNESWYRTTALWVIMYAGFWIFALGDKLYRYEAWDTSKLALEVMLGTVKTLPSLLIFLLIYVKMPPNLFPFSGEGDKPEVLDAELARSSRDAE
jgi:hypothetical protein